MYRCLNVETLGITGRQSELIELALTNRFKGLDIDMEAFSWQVEKRGQEHAMRYIESARKSCGMHVGTWHLPVRWQSDDATFKADLQKLPAMANVAKLMGATRCYTVVSPASETLPLKENFEFHTARFNEIAELLSPHEISLGLGFHAAEAARKGQAHQFIVTADALLTLVDTVNSPNVGLLVDTWNWHLGGGTVDQIVDRSDRVVAIRVADVVPDATAENAEVAQRLLPSTEGVIPFADLFSKLSEKDWDGPVVPYPHVSQFKGTTRDKIVVLTSEALRSVWPGADILEEEAAEAGEGGVQEGPSAPEKGDEKAEKAENSPEETKTDPVASS